MKENTMFKSIPLVACLVCFAVLMGAGSVSARAGGFPVPVVARQHTECRMLEPSTSNLLGKTLSQTLKFTLGASNALRSTDSSAAPLLQAIWSVEIDSEGEKHDSVKPSHHHEGEDEDERE